MDSTTAPSLFIVAAALRSEQRDAEAVPLLEQALESASTFPAVAVELARSLNAVGRSRDALAVLKRARRRWPEEADVCHVAGVAYQLSDDLLRAARCYDKALALDPTHHGSWFNLHMMVMSRPLH